MYDTNIKKVTNFLLPKICLLLVKKKKGEKKKVGQSQYVVLEITLCVNLMGLLTYTICKQVIA